MPKNYKTLLKDNDIDKKLDKYIIKYLRNMEEDERYEIVILKENGYQGTQMKLHQEN